MKIRYVIFDMDGTILNTIDDLCDSVNYMLTKLNYPNKTLAEVKSFVGNGIVKLVERVLPKGYSMDEFNIAFDTFKSYYAVNNKNKTAPYDGILEAMQELRNLGIGMAVVSNKYDAGVKQLSKELFADYLPVAIGESESVKPKPLPDGVFLAMKELGADFDNTVYIGDSEVDFATAKNSNLQFIGVSWGFRTRELLESLGAEHIIDKPSQILAELEKIN